MLAYFEKYMSPELIFVKFSYSHFKSWIQNRLIDLLPYLDRVLPGSQALFGARIAVQPRGHRAWCLYTEKRITHTQNLKYIKFLKENYHS